MNKTIIKKCWLVLVGLMMGGMLNAQSVITVAGNTNFAAGAVSYTSISPTDWNRTGGYDGQPANTFLDGGEKGSSGTGIVTYTLNVTNPGRYNIIVRAGSAWGDTMNVTAYVNDNRAGATGNFTGIGGNWFTCAIDRTAIPADFCEGNNILRIEGTGAISITRITLTRTGDATSCGPQAPTVTAQSPSGLSATGATLRAALTAKGTENVTAKGIRWGTTDPGTPSDTAWGTGLAETTGADLATGAFSGDIACTQGQTYYYYAYATNSVGTSYSNVISFVAEDCAPTTYAMCLVGNVTIVSGDAGIETPRPNSCGNNYGSLNNPVMKFTTPSTMCAGLYTVSHEYAAQGAGTSYLGFNNTSNSAGSISFATAATGGWGAGNASEWKTVDGSGTIELGPGIDLYFFPTGTNPAKLTFVPVVPPAAPVIAIAQAGQAKLTVSWAAVERAVDYTVYDGEGNEIEAGVTGTSFTTDALEVGEEYCFQVKARNAVGYSGFSNEVCATVDDPTFVNEDANVVCEGGKTDNLVGYWTIKSVQRNTYLYDDNAADGNAGQGLLKHGGAAANTNAQWIREEVATNQWRLRNVATNRYWTVGNDKYWGYRDSQNWNAVQLGAYNAEDANYSIFVLSNWESNNTVARIRANRWDTDHFLTTRYTGALSNNNANPVWNIGNAIVCGGGNDAGDHNKFEIIEHAPVTYPDIVVKSITFDAVTVALGSAVTGEIEIENIAPNGAVAAGEVIKLNLSFNGQFFYEYYTVPAGGLVAGATSAAIPFSFTPALATSAATLTVKANSDLAIDELNCENNDLTSTETVSLIEPSVNNSPLASFTMKWTAATDEIDGGIIHPQGIENGSITFEVIKLDNNALKLGCMEVYFELNEGYDNHLVVLEGPLNPEKHDSNRIVLGEEEDWYKNPDTYVCFGEIGEGWSWSGFIHVYDISSPAQPAKGVFRVNRVEGLEPIATYSLDIISGNENGMTTDLGSIGKGEKELQDCFTITGVKVNCNDATPNRIIIKRYTDGSAEKVLK